MSFEQALLRASNEPAEASTRAILWLAAADDTKLTKKSASAFENLLNTSGNVPGHLSVTCDIIDNGYYVDAVVNSGNRLGVLAGLVETTDRALLETFEATIEGARIGNFLAEPNSYLAWELMTTSPGTDASDIAAETAAQHRDRYFSNIGQAILHGID
jgi:hypothetical protein